MWKRIGIRAKFMISFLSVFLIASLTMFLVFSSLTKILHSNLYQINLAALEQTGNLIESQLEEVDTLMLLVSRNEAIQNAFFNKNPIAPENITYAPNFVKARDLIGSYVNMNSFIEELLLYHAKENYMISSSSIYLRPTELKEAGASPGASLLGYMDQICAASTSMLPYEIKRMESPWNESAYLVFSRCIVQAEQYITVLIDTKKLNAFFNSDITTGNYYMLDDSGEILYQSEIFFQLTSEELAQMEASTTYEYEGES